MRFFISGLSILSLIIASSAFASEYMTATIIGSGSPVYNKNRSDPSVLISLSELHILLDMGNGTKANLNKAGIDSRDLDALLFTHHHLDHNEEFVPILIHSLMGNKDISIIGPPDTIKLTETSLDLYAKDIAYRLGKTQRTLSERKKALTVKDIKGGESFTIAGIKVSALKVPHSLYAIAYRFDYKKQSIVVTGDLTYTEALSSFAKNADYMIIDSGGMVMTGGKLHKDTDKNSHSKNNRTTSNKRSRIRAHLNLNDSSLLAKQAQIKNLVYSHFTAGDVNEKASLKEIKTNYQGNVIFAEDLMVFGNLDNASSIKTSKVQITNAKYPVVDTSQTNFYSDTQDISQPNIEETFYGQDASYIINSPSYTNNNDGTVTDNVTGLIWQQTMGHKLSYEEAFIQAKSLSLGGHNDWRVPTIKELYSLIQFTGKVKMTTAIEPFIDVRYFKQPIGDSSKGERQIDAQTWSSTKFVGKTMGKDETIFGVNFVDGRIKGYPLYSPSDQKPNKMYFRFVRGNSAYGKNSFQQKNNETVVDLATGLMWQKADSLEGMDWQEALQYAENLTLDGYDDWRLPNAKELQSIVDYSRSPDTSNSPSIDPVFETSRIVNEDGRKDFPYYWTSTTHLDGPMPQASAVYIAFGRALGKMHGRIMDVHGAGSQRSDPKTGNATSRGPQGDYVRVKNFVRVVRGGTGQADPDKSIVSTEVHDQNNEKQFEQQIKKNRKKPLGRVRFMKRLDKNADGKVSTFEFKGPDKHFKHLDKDGNGYISEDKIPVNRKKVVI